ncbi:MAG: tRNA-dihydrouridine synthase, partial [Pusillimonas sp.]|nr:tRNA-dihydrouridine synthase [Pusillimonas sp.]
SPKVNREIPPLRYRVAEQLRSDFPDSIFILNGGIVQVKQAVSLLRRFDGVMLGRAAWHDPAVLSSLSSRLWPDTPVSTEMTVIQGMIDYAALQVRKGVPLRLVVRPMLGWLTGRPGARRWRQILSDPAHLNGQDPWLIARAYEEVARQTSFNV